MTAGAPSLIGSLLLLFIRHKPAKPPNPIGTVNGAPATLDVRRSKTSTVAASLILSSLTFGLATQPGADPLVA